MLKAIKVNYALLSWFLPQADQFFHQKLLVSRLALSKFSRRTLSKGLPDKRYPMGEKLLLESVNVEIAIADLYRQVEFVAEARENE